jgi:hypothetical protein
MTVNDPGSYSGDLPLEEMSLSAATPPSPSWSDLLVYQREVHPVFHAIPDFRASVRFFVLHRSKLKDILADWTKN